MPPTSARPRRALRSVPGTPGRTAAASLVWAWAALWFLVGGWIGFTPIYVPPHASASLLLLAAVALGTTAFARTSVRPLPRPWLALLLPLCLFIALVPWPHSLGGVLLAGSLTALAAARGKPWLSRGAVALGACGLAALLLASSQPVLWRLFARSHATPWAAQAVALILRGVGAKVGVSGSVLHLRSFGELSPINVTWEALGFHAVAMFVIAGAALLLVSRAGLRRWLTFLGISCAYAIVRYAVLLLVCKESGRADLLWSPWVTALTFLPLGLLVGRYVTSGMGAPPAVRWPRLGLTPGTGGALLLSGGAVVCLVGLFSFQDAGVRKQGRILIDEAHSDWERTTRKYDTEWYNEASGYNYYCLGDFLGYFYSVHRGRQPLTPEVLRRYDVLVLKTLTEPLQPAEIDAIVGFVRAGGGLWLLGDHTNVFGISAHMNPLARRFGLKYKYDATYDLRTGALTTYRRSVMIPHPTVQHMPPVFLFGTSCSLEASPWADYPIIGYGLRALRADYSRENFFPESGNTLDQEHGLLLQQAALRYGRGRVVAFTDSTVFSNFWFYMPGKSELCLSTIDWLDRANRWPLARWLFGAALACALGLMVRSARRLGPSVFAVWVLTGALLAAPLAVRAFATLNRAAYPVPGPGRPLPRIAFERGHCNFTLPSESMDATQVPQNHYHTFFVWTQRLGYMPKSVPFLRAALATAKVVVLANPSKDFSDEELRLVRRYLETGGRILVLDGAHNVSSTADQLLDGVGLKIEATSFPESFVFDRTGKRVASARLPRQVTGGEPLLKLAFGKPLAAAARVGKGMIVAIGSSHLFTDRSLGVTSVIPNGYQRGLYEIEFWLFRNLMEGPSDPKLWGPPRPPAEPGEHD